MARKDLQQQARFQVGSKPVDTITCEQVQAINAKIGRGEMVTEDEMARASEHTRICDNCRSIFSSQK